AYCAMCDSPIDRLELGERDTILDSRHFSWSSPQILSIGPSMLTGATLVLARKFSQARFFDWVRDYRVTVAVGIPTVINMLLARPTAVTKADLPALRFMTSSTAPLSVDKHLEFERTYGIPIVQLAGGTETGFMCGNEPDRRKVGSIGRPTLNMPSLEITNCLLEHPDVAEAATLGAKDEIYGEVPVGFVALRPGRAASTTALLEHCGAKLAAFKVPTAVVVVDAIPKNPNGKL